MAQEAAAFGSKSWFLQWGERLANAGLTAVTNLITGQKVGQGVPTVTPGSLVKPSFSWLPYAIAGGFVLILVLVLRKK